MTSRTKTFFLAALLTVTVAGTTWWFFGREHGRKPAVVQKPPAPKIAAKPAPTPTITPVAVPAPEPPKPQQAQELAGTEQMYLAHAPLRVAEVANPDSASNHQILQTMVLKALREARTAPPATTQKP